MFFFFAWNLFFFCINKDLKLNLLEEQSTGCELSIFFSNSNCIWLLPARMHICNHNSIKKEKKNILIFIFHIKLMIFCVVVIVPSTQSNTSQILITNIFAWLHFIFCRVRIMTDHISVMMPKHRIKWKWNYIFNYQPGPCSCSFCICITKASHNRNNN